MQGSAPPEPASRTRKRTPSGELAFIRGIRSRVATQEPGRGGLLLGIGDDCAILRLRRGEDLVVTTDFCLEGRHFRRDWHSAASAGHRTLARGLSDLAAMGSRPLAIFLSLALPRGLPGNGTWVNEYLDGLLTLARRVGVPLAGGDTAEAPGQHLVADIVCAGAVQKGRALRRDGARPGDDVYVTGTLGGAAAELASLPQRSRRRGLQPTNVMPGAHPQLFPEPRLACGQFLARRQLATAALDISDGLSTDLLHLCEASDVGAEIDEAALPLHPLLDREERPIALARALHGGEDYELLFTARHDATLPRRLRDVSLTKIGRILPRQPRRPRLTLIDAAGRHRPLRAAGWEHLR